ncbi:hypothetical protein [Tengunoibacter tsumagoiensis]|uniref:General stress protein 17M-like domain-containing protein n=1 Tax=Tengunoibacter tsumagoiensis TaxID=2014871 RepID=A0A401ZWC6_9CHLR|nr:hypothetical protein [Tengunoibacter tsumagoiensis]GCE11209.1 hypothetical protein KTT_10680 [Tengunoibacter tsumagoiensis]
MTTPEQAVVIGVFEDRKAVVRAIDALIKAGFHEEQLGFAALDHNAQQDNEVISQYGPIRRGILGGLLGAADMLLVPITGPTDAATLLRTALPVTEEALDNLPYPGSPAQEEMVHPDDAMRQPLPPDDEAPIVMPPQKKAPPTSMKDSSETASVITGGVVGGVIGAAAALLIPGVGPAIAGGILVGALGGGAIGSVAGGFLGAFTNMGVPKAKAQYYEHEVKKGRTLLTVHTSDRQEEIIALLRHYGAHDVEAH